MAAPSPVDLQKSYWTYDPGEHAELQARGIAALSWPERLRFHHLNCLELVEGPEGQAALSGAIHIDPRMPKSDEELGKAEERRVLGRLLLSDESPYRPRLAMVWQGDGTAPVNDRQPPRRVGSLRNASLTHLGALEIIRLDVAYQPLALDFVPFCDVEAVIFAGPALFRAAKIIYTHGKTPGPGEEVVLAPLLYGPSWFSSDSADQDGSMTRFFCHDIHERYDGHSGLGLGQQDFVLHGSVFGLGSVQQLIFPPPPS